jgi:hypothetical protein
MATPTPKPYTHANLQKPSLEMSRALFHIVVGSFVVVYFFLASRTGELALLAVGLIAAPFDILRIRSATVRRIIPNYLMRMVRDRERSRVSGFTHFILGGLASVNSLFPSTTIRIPHSV